MQTSPFWVKSACIYGTQTSPVVLCMQNGVISTRITSLYGSQPISVVFAFKTATFGPELYVAIGTRPHPSFWACKTSWLVPEILVSMGHSRHLWFLHAKQRLLDQNYKTLLGLDHSVLSTRITSLYWSQLSSVVFACKTETFGPE